MRVLVSTIAVGLSVVSATGLAKAQQADAAPSNAPASADKPAQLPTVTVQTSKPEPAAPKKKPVKTVVKPTAAEPQPPATAPAPPEDAFSTTDSGGATAETGLGPVKGIVATKTVTGTKTDTPILEVPKTVNVVTRDQVEAQQPQSVKEALSYTPAVQNQTGTGSIFDNIAVRGFTAPIFLDGLRLPSDYTLSFARVRLEPFSLERLEVLKGPSSGLFGSSPPGGLINAVSKRPQQTPHAETFVQFGTNDYKAAGFDFTGPVDAGRIVSYRVTGLVRDTDLDFDFADRQRYSIAPSLTIRPSADTSLTLLASAQKDAGFGPHQFVPLELTKKSTAPLGRISRSSYYGDPSFDDSNEDQWQIGYAFEHRFDSVFQFRQNVRYSETELDLSALRAGSFFGMLDAVRNPRNSAIVQGDARAFQADTQLQADFSTGALDHVLLAGVDYLKSNGASLFKTGTATPVNVYNPVYGDPIGTPVNTLFDSIGNVEQTGIYLQDQIKLGNWIATLSGRHDWATTDVEDQGFVAAVPTTHIVDRAWTGSAGLSYQFESGLAPYISYSTSFLPVAGQQVTDGDGNPFKPTTGEGYEAGIKYQPPGTRTLISAAIFENTLQDVVTTSPVDPDLLVQTGEVRVRGFEIEGKTSISDNIDLIAGYAYLEPIITAGEPAGDDPTTTGNDFANVSRHTASLWGKYTWREGALNGLGVGAGIRYVGTQFAEDQNTSKVPAYAVVDALVSYELGQLARNFDGATLQLNAYNLFDDYYIAACTGGANFCQFGAERSFIATLKYEW